MAKTPEKKVKDKVAKILKNRGVYYFFPATGGYGRNGVPDIVGCYRGRFIAIECKAGGNALTKLQELELDRIVAAGGFAFTVNERNISEVTEFLDALDIFLREP